MKNTCALIVFLIVSTGLFNQINAQLPHSILTEKLNYSTDNQKVNYLSDGLDFFCTTNNPPVKKAKLKAAQADQELLDSVVYLETYEGVIYGGDKKTWSYDADGNKTHQSWYYWSTEANAWKGRQRLDSTYDANGNLSTIISDSWNDETKQWVPGNKTELTYNSDGDLILHSNFSWNNDTSEWDWKTKTESTHSYTADNVHVIFSINYIFNDETEEWTPHHRNELNYDSNGNQTLYNASLFDSATNSWVFKAGSFKYENSYNEQGNQTLQSFYTWNSEKNQWKGGSDLIERTYDALGNATMIVHKEWDESLNQWVNSSKSESSYNDNGLILHTTYQWDSVNDDWLAVHQTENNFNENETLSRVIESEWDIEQNKWVNISQHELLYDANGNLSQFNILQIDTVSDEWYVSAKDEYTYNADNKEVLKERFKLNDDSQLVIFYKKETAYDAYGNVVLFTVYEPNAESGDLVKSNESEFTYNQSGDKLIEVVVESIYYDGIPYILKTNYYYSIHSVTSSIDIKTEVPGVYPNPFTDQLSFHLNNNYNQIAFELFDSQGHKVMSKRVLNAETISITNLSRGVYFYRLSLDNKIQRGKLIKK